MARRSSQNIRYAAHYSFRQAYIIIVTTILASPAVLSRLAPGDNSAREDGESRMLLRDMVQVNAH